ncbi:MAG: ABC transporter ATP-binding protein [Abitibacteriaceae bacterium]|nr:ABC transporter ATP-binding protein [Abditibacteriaceae bacterium]MBV9865090.1 ABC transporter ATP-binding protein [Abditibacteriaceae bacterium]
MLELRQITKTFGSFKALDEVDLVVREGEIVGLLGENGAGKSTLMNIIGGVLTPTAGQLRWDDEPVHLASPRAATQRGIGVVHQHFMLVPVFTVAENIALHAPQAGAVFNADEWNARIQAWAQTLGWKIDGTQRVADLSVGELQRVEILKALFANDTAQGSGMEDRESSIEDRGSNQNQPVPNLQPPASKPQTPSSNTARLLLLDEPTANLTPAEVEELFKTLRRLREQQRGIIFVSHKLNEVLALCDRIVILRHGRIVGERRTMETNAQELATLMVGRELRDVDQRPPVKPNPDAATAPRLIIENLSGGTLRNFSLSIQPGEIVGLAGVDGNGQRELVEILSGLRSPQGGRFGVADGQPIAVIPPDRQTVGLIQSFDLAENMALNPTLRAQCRTRFTLNWKAARQKTHALMQQFDVRAPATAERTLAANLSGGNQQKVIIARALSFPHGAVVAADPTRGLDVGATQFVHEQLRTATNKGAAVLLISTDLDEVIQLSDRIGVLYEGRLLPSAELLKPDTNREIIGALMGGNTMSA